MNIAKPIVYYFSVQVITNASYSLKSDFPNLTDNTVKTGNFGNRRKSDFFNLTFITVKTVNFWNRRKSDFLNLTGITVKTGNLESCASLNESFC